jgi:hypothetical protein
MRISTSREFRDTTGLLCSRTPILVTRRGRVAGIFFLTLPIVRALLKWAAADNDRTMLFGAELHLKLD